MRNLTPKNIVKELNNYIISQDKAKKAVAIALRNRWRRQMVQSAIKEEIMPNNIILIGPTGVGKTEISRRLSNLANAPFIKVEASKFTEVGYVGRDVESMVRELLNISINSVRQEMARKVQTKARKNAIKRILNKLLPKPPKSKDEDEEERKNKQDRYEKNRAKMKKMLKEGKLDEREIEIRHELPKKPHIEIFSNTGLENIDFQFGEMISNMLPFKKQKKKKKYKISEAIEKITEMEAAKLINKDKVITKEKKRVENDGIIFIDEIDKIATDKSYDSGKVSRSGVQRDLLPIVEGSNVPTKHGLIDTSHILFIAAGAFNMSKPSDLIPELQGRFPIREELKSLTQKDFEKILVYPKNSLTKQYKAIFKSENVKLEFSDEAISEIAAYATKANEKMEDIGARRLYTIMNSLLEEYLFEMPDKKYKQVKITRKIVKEKLEKIIKDEDLSKYIL
mgnify:FL=1